MNYRTNLLRVSILAIAAWPAAGLSSSAWPAVVYRITEIPAFAAGGESRALGINNRGEVVGEADVAITLETGIAHTARAFLWLPAAAYGLPAGLNNLGALGDPGAFNVDSAAREVNEVGQVVGVSTTVPGTRRAFLWLPEPACGLPAGLNNLGTLPDGGHSEAWSINSESPPKVCGTAVSSASCGSAPNQDRGFLWDCATVTMSALGPTGSLFRSFARDLNTPAAGSELVIAGQSAHCFELLCSFEKPSTWVNSLPRALGLLPGDAEAEAHGVSRSGRLVGHSGGLDMGCQPDAVYWAAPTIGEAPINIGALLGGPKSMAEAINSAHAIVGRNVTNNRALLWRPEPDGTYATVVDLNTVSNCGGAAWTLLEAWDINDSGWIVGVGFRNGAVRGYLLTPMTDDCPEDLDMDGDVDVSDLLALLAAWGPCSSTFCNADFDCDRQVANPDLLALLAAWGSCAGGAAGGGAIPQSIQDCLDKFLSEDPLALVKCIEAVGP
jgi:probable HAF family extracellular repeat protein